MFSNFDDVMWGLNYDEGDYEVKHVFKRFM